MLLDTGIIWWSSIKVIKMAFLNIENSLFVFVLALWQIQLKIAFRSYK